MGGALTIIVIVVVIAHKLFAGVKVYFVVAKLFNDGAQVPDIPLFEVVGSANKVFPEQIGAACVKIGVTEFTVIVIVAVVAHNPAVGVKVYVVVAKLFSVGNHVPAIPFVEVVGKAAKVAPEQIGAT